MVLWEINRNKVCRRVDWDCGPLGDKQKTKCVEGWIGIRATLKIDNILIA